MPGTVFHNETVTLGANQLCLHGVGVSRLPGASVVWHWAILLLQYDSLGPSRVLLVAQQLLANAWPQVRSLDGIARCRKVKEDAPPAQCPALLF